MKLRIFAILTAPLFIAAVIAHTQTETGSHTLQARAERVFSYDRQHGGKLPAHEVRTLSLALAFHDHEGAEQILTKLEASL